MSSAHEALDRAADRGSGVIAILAANAARRTAIARPTQITLVGRYIGVRSSIKIAAQSGGSARGTRSGC
jgi:hypothetical protein